VAASIIEKKAADAQRKRDARAKAAAAETAAAEAEAAEKAAVAAAEKAAAMKKRADARAEAEAAETDAFEPPTPEEAAGFKAWCVRNTITPPGPKLARQLFMRWKRTNGNAAETSEAAAKEVKRWTVIHSCRYYDRSGERRRALAGKPIDDIDPRDAASLRRRGHIEPYQEPSKPGLSPVAATG